jgi:hypothetical protein
LIGSTEFDPNGKVKVKSVEGAVVETHGTLTLHIREAGLINPFKFHVVGKQVDLLYDGILVRDFLKHTKATVCYEKSLVTFKQGNKQWTKRLSGNRWDPDEGIEIESALVRETNGTDQGAVEIKKLILPKRSEVIVSLPVKNGMDDQEGLIDKSTIAEGIYLASSLTRVKGDQVITSILNTRDEEMTIEVPIIEWDNCDKGEFQREDPEEYVGSTIVVKENKTRNRMKEVLRKLRLGHLNPEEREAIEKVCKDYHDIFHLPEEELSCTNAVRHSRNVIPGTNPVNTRPYRLPEAQKTEIEKPIDKLVKEGVVEESNSPWNSPLLVVPKKDDASGENKWRLVVDFRKLNEKTVGDAYPLPDITEILDQFGQSKYFSCLDMVMGYHQIELKEEDKEKTAFSTKNGLWAYKRLL